MGCQSEVWIGHYLTFSVTTHDPDTGVLTDADAAPTYRIYEDETAAAILNGSMAILDNVNTTGFYTERVACTAANGFENGKSYTVYIEATVDSDTGGIAYGFRAITPPFSVSAVNIAAAMAGEVVTIKRGDSLSLSITGLGDLTNKSKLWFTVKDNLADADSAAIIQIDDDTGLLYLNAAAAAVAANGSITIDDAVAGDITVALDEAETDDLVPAIGLTYDVQMLDTSNDVSTLTEGPCNITGDVTRAIT